MTRWLLGSFVLGVVLSACGSTQIGTTSTGSGAPRPKAPAAPPAHTGPTQPTDVQPALPHRTIWFDSVGLDIPASWPVIDGAHFGYPCGSAFEDQSDRAFLGASVQGAPSCPAVSASAALPRTDGVWMERGGDHPPGVAPTRLPAGQIVYVLAAPPNSAVDVWFHGVSIEIGIGPDPAIEQSILDSITSRPGTPDSPVAGRCPAPDPIPLPMPAPQRATAAGTLPDQTAELRPEPPDVEPAVSAATVWSSFAGQGPAIAGAHHWSLTFGSYSAETPATLQPDGSATPIYTGVPTWLIEGTAVATPYGPCGESVVAPMNATTGASMGLEIDG